MNNNLNFSKNMFGGQTETKIAGDAILPGNNDGGRRSLEDVREMQMNANNGIRPDMNNHMNNQLPPRPNDTQMNMRSKMEAMRSINGNNGGFPRGF